MKQKIRLCILALSIISSGTNAMSSLLAHSSGGEAVLEELMPETPGIINRIIGRHRANTLSLNEISVIGEELFATMSDIIREKQQINAMHNENPLMAAVKQGDLAALHTLLQNNPAPDIQQQDADGRTALHLAAYYGHADCIRELLQAGATINQHDNEGRTPLHYAVKSQLARIVCIPGKLPLRVNQDFAPLNRPVFRGELRFYYDGLMEEALNQNNNDGIAAIQALLDNNAETSIDSATDGTPLGLALRTKDLMPRAPQQEIDAIIRLLNDHHASLNPREAVEHCRNQNQQVAKFEIDLKKYDRIRTDGESHLKLCSKISKWTRNICAASIVAAVPIAIQNPFFRQLPPSIQGITAAAAFSLAWLGLPRVTSGYYDIIEGYRAERLSRSLQRSARNFKTTRSGPITQSALRWILTDHRELPANTPRPDRLRLCLANQMGVQL